MARDDRLEALRKEIEELREEVAVLATELKGLRDRRKCCANESSTLKGN
jgi:cell division septum initiation protein DivIVA